MNYTNVEEIIASAKIRLRLTDTNQPDMALEHYILQGAKSINALDSYILKQKKLEIVNGSATLPEDYHVLIAARLLGIHVDQQSVSVGSGGECRRALYVNAPYLYASGCDCADDSMVNFSDTFQIVGNEIVFNSQAPADYILLTYEARSIDANGLPCFPEDHSRALIAYSCYQYAMSYRVTQLDPSGYMPDQVEAFRQEWIAQKAWCRGNAVKKDARHRRSEIMATVNALITGKNPYLK
jgi:hypothetical protein